MDSIEFTGYLVNEEKDRIYKHSKIFIMPSEREGFSIATLEAMAYAVVPVVAEPKFKELFGIGQYLKDGYNGFTYPVGKLEQLVQVIERLIDNRTLFEMLSKNAQDTSSCYTWEKSANLLTEFIRGVL
jgi:glycosyltransferase involved in cell wall biosynthesis